MVKLFVAPPWVKDAALPKFHVPVAPSAMAGLVPAPAGSATVPYPMTRLPPLLMDALSRASPLIELTKVPSVAPEPTPYVLKVYGLLVPMVKVDAVCAPF